MPAHIQNNVQKLRTQKKVTQEDLAKVVGVTRQTIIAIEKGNYTPSVTLAMNIARFFHTTVEEVFIIND